ncbi:hypothetical protein DFH09DRAFT_1477182 [Mycena vulgaris]|nr:hypothetical protein DFH09DRAFT_1477182 [Mycena vulgaris]
MEVRYDSKPTPKSSGQTKATPAGSAHEVVEPNRRDQKYIASLLTHHVRLWRVNRTSSERSCRATQQYISVIRIQRLRGHEDLKPESQGACVGLGCTATTCGPNSWALYSMRRNLSGTYWVIRSREHEDSYRARAGGAAALTPTRVSLRKWRSLRLSFWGVRRRKVRAASSDFNVYQSSEQEAETYWGGAASPLVLVDGRKSSSSACCTPIAFFAVNIPSDGESFAAKYPNRRREGSVAGNTKPRWVIGSEKDIEEQDDGILRPPTATATTGGDSDPNSAKAIFLVKATLRGVTRSQLRAQ